MPLVGGACEVASQGLEHVFADRVYRGKQLVNALSGCGPWTIEIVERPPPGFKASNCPGGGSSSAPLPGSEDTGASQKTSKAWPQPSSPGRSPPIYRLLTRRLAMLHDILQTALNDTQSRLGSKLADTHLTTLKRSSIASQLAWIRC